MIYLASIVAGLMLGSFANVCMVRMPRGESIRFPASHCPACQKPLRWFDNIPLWSYLHLQGRCHFCHERISRQYPLIEMAMSLLFLLSACRFPGDVVRIAILDLFSFYALAISVIDGYHKIIPDELSLTLVVWGLLVSWKNPFLLGHSLPAPVESFLAALAGGAGMLLFAWGGEKMFKKEAMGGGDIKLMAGFGALLGWQGLLGALLIGSTLGALYGGSLLLLKRIKRSETIPFGPFLCLGAYLSCLFPGWTKLFLSP